jgi:hypothetical protein
MMIRIFLQLASLSQTDLMLAAALLAYEWLRMKDVVAAIARRTKAFRPTRECVEG